jgi:hypothetical protein
MRTVLPHERRPLPFVRVLVKIQPFQLIERGERLLPILYNFSFLFDIQQVGSQGEVAVNALQL